MADGLKRALKFRCAIYTRKSSEEGLEQEFNSLQAQREACEAFITSQKGEGWQTLKAHYDDGGWSGGTLDRPALQRLLSDIRTSKVDVVLVYKIDRLTRSLLDFAKIVEVFNAHGVSFVSVTQAFNTSTSMGRLTLNVLLSFAQFEREVTGERIRDKIAASKRRGMWMGGFAPLGYDAKDRMLVINKEEAESVRFIFRRYLELSSVYKLKSELDARRITSKLRPNANGKARGGRPITAGALYHLLQNPIYCGRVGHRELSYDGMHEAIIKPALWEAVQRSLAVNRRERRNGTSAKEPSLLAGLIVDAEGARLTPSHAAKGGKRYRYYVSRGLITDPGRASQPSWRLPAAELERFIVKQIGEFLVDQNEIWAFCKEAKLSHQQGVSALKRANQLAQTLLRGPNSAVRSLLLHLVKRIMVHTDRIVMELSRVGLLKQLSEGVAIESRAKDGDRTIVLNTSCQFRRRGMEMRLVIGDKSGGEGRPDATLIAALVRAHAWWQELCSGKSRSIKELSDRDGSDQRYVARNLKLAFLAPDITADILEGRQPAHLSADALIKMSHLPYTWKLQRQRLGFVQRLSSAPSLRP
jgi:DNA invertase Pin-like site-specific DNA recombinase